MRFVTLCVLSIALFGCGSKSNYAGCMVENLKGVQNEQSRVSALNLCKSKYPSQYSDLKVGVGNGFLNSKTKAQCVLENGKSIQYKNAIGAMTYACHCLYDEPSYESESCDPVENRINNVLGGKSNLKPWEQYQQKQTNAKIDELMKNAPPFDPNTAKPVEPSTIQNTNTQPSAQTVDDLRKLGKQFQDNQQFLSQKTGIEREHYEKILSVHPDAIQIAQSQDFANWKVSLQGELKSKVENTLQSGEAEKVNIVLRWYKEDRGMIPKQN